MTKTNGHKRFLTVQEFAFKTGLSAAAVYLAIKQKRIGCISGFGERKAIPVEELQHVTRRKKVKDAPKIQVLRRDRFDI